MAKSKALTILLALRRKLGTEIAIRDPYGLINTVLRDVLERVDFIPLWKIGSIATVATYSTGTIDVDIGSNTWTGTDTVFDAVMVGRKITLGVDTPYYRISAVNSTTELETSTNYAGSENQSDENYTIFQDEYSLPSDFSRMVSEIRDLDNNEVLTHRDVGFGDDMYTVETSAGTPDITVMIRTDANGLWQVRFQPAPNAVNNYELRYRATRTVINAWNDEIEIPIEDEELILAGMVAKIVPSEQNRRDYERYFRQFKANVDKDEGVKRYFKTGMYEDNRVLAAAPRWRDKHVASNY